jgi:hypothetical protein
MTQQNAALVEELSSNSDSMRKQITHSTTCSVLHLQRAATGIRQKKRSNLNHQTSRQAN